MSHLYTFVAVFIFLRYCFCLQSNDSSFETELFRLGVKLSRKHSIEFVDLYRNKFFHGKSKQKGKVKNHQNRQKRAFWGLDQFFTDAEKTKNHFGSLNNRIGNIFAEEEDQVLLVPRFISNSYYFCSYSMTIMGIMRSMGTLWHQKMDIQQRRKRKRRRKEKRKLLRFVDRALQVFLHFLPLEL